LQLFEQATTSAYLLSMSHDNGKNYWEPSFLDFEPENPCL